MGLAVVMGRVWLDRNAEDRVVVAADIVVVRIDHNLVEGIVVAVGIALSVVLSREEAGIVEEAADN